MKMLFVANTSRDPNQGASGCDIATMDALRRQGHIVDEVWGDDMPRRIRHPNLHQLLELPHNFASVVASRRRNRNYDVIQVNQPHAYLAAFRHRRAGCPGIFINRSHGWEPAVSEAVTKYGDPKGDVRPLWRRLASWPLSKALHRHNRLVLQGADGIVVCSHDDLDFIRCHDSIPDERILALAPGLAIPFLDSIPTPINDRWCKILYVGSFMPQKAPLVVARVFTSLIEQRPELTFTWVCAARDHEAARQMTGGDHNGRIVFQDWMPRERLIHVYDTHGLLIFPSLFEGFALTPLEAMARGMCVLSSAIDGMKQTIRDSQNGYLFPRGAADDIAARAAQLVTRPDHCESISKAARQTASEFTWDRTATEYLKFCERLVAFKASGLHRVAT